MKIHNFQGELISISALIKLLRRTSSHSITLGEQMSAYSGTISWTFNYSSPAVYVFCVKMARKMSAKRLDRNTWHSKFAPLQVLRAVYLEFCWLYDSRIAPIKISNLRLCIDSANVLSPVLKQEPHGLWTITGLGSLLKCNSCFSLAHWCLSITTQFVGIITVKTSGLKDTYQCQDPCSVLSWTVLSKLSGICLHQ